MMSQVPPEVIEAAKTLEAYLRTLVTHEHGCVSIGFNENPTYETVKEYHENARLDEDDPDYWVSPEERERAFETNSEWRIHWYPRNQIGSYSVSASNLASVIEWSGMPEDKS